MTVTPIIAAEGRGLLRVEEAAQYLSLGRSKFYELLAPRGPIPAIRVGRATRVPRVALDRWIEERVDGAMASAEVQ